MEVVAHIVERTDGVPLFVEELTKSVLESELLREEGDHYVLDDVGDNLHPAMSCHRRSASPELFGPADPDDSTPAP